MVTSPSPKCEQSLRPLPDQPLESGAISDSLLFGPFLRPHLDGRHRFLVERDLDAGVDVRAVLPEPAELVALHRRHNWVEALARVGDAFLLVRSWKESADVWVSADDESVARALAAHVVGQVPPAPVDQRVRVHFWMRTRGSSSTSRDLDVPDWASVRAQYPAAVAAAMDRLVAFRPPASGRLILWHGPPGTGKTTAVRALFDGWRDWCTAHVVSDPETLLGDGKYLQEVLFRDDGERWRLVVVEDAEELLRRDARAMVGPALGRLLNVGDGLLGQGSRVLVLLTTNERIGELHPALLRPGRCLARMEFPRLSAAEASGLLGRPVADEMSLAEVFEARGTVSRLSAAPAPVAVGQYL